MSAPEAPAVHRRLLSNAALLGVNTVVLSGAGFVFWVLAARLYTPSDVGLTSAALAWVPLLVMVASVGLPTTLVRLLHPSTDRFALVLTGLLLTAAAAVPAAAVWWFVAQSSPLREYGWGPVVALAALLGLALSAVCDSVMVAMRRPGLMLIESVLAAAGRLLGLVLLASFAATGMMLAWVAGALLSGASSLALALVLVRRHPAPEGTARPQGRPVRERLRASSLFAHTPFALANWAAISISAVPAAVLPSVALVLVGASYAAFVSISLMMLPMFTLIPSMVARSTYAEASADPSRLRTLTARSMRLALAGQLVMLVCVVLAAPFVLSLFGGDYMVAVPLVRLLALASFVATLNYFGDMVLHVRRDPLAIVLSNGAGSLFVLAFAAWGASFSLTGLGVGFVVGQLVYAAASWTLIVLRRGRQVAAL